MLPSAGEEEELPSDGEDENKEVVEENDDKLSGVGEDEYLGAEEDDLLKENVEEVKESEDQASDEEVVLKPEIETVEEQQEVNNGSKESEFGFVWENGKSSCKAGNVKKKKVEKKVHEVEDKKAEGSGITSWLAKKNKRKATVKPSVKAKVKRGGQFRAEQALKQKETDLMKILENPLTTVDFTEFRTDLLGSGLLPCDVDGLPSDNRTLKCTGDGNCLFNSVSILLCGEEERFPLILRKLACDFVDKNRAYMAHHPALKAAAKAMRRTEDFVFVQSLSMVTQKQVWDKCKDREQCLMKEIQICRKPKTYASMLVFLGLVEVIKRPVVSIYPNTNQQFRLLYHQKIIPSVVVEDKPLYLLWSKDTDLDDGKGVIFHANHIVPVVEG